MVRFTSCYHWLLAIIFACACTLQAFAAAPPEFQSSEHEERYRALIEEVRCMVCMNQNLADSEAGLAKDLRTKILGMIEAGKTDAEIKEFLVSRYSDFILYKPPVNEKTYALWLAPALFFFGGAAFLVFYIRKRQRIQPQDLAAVDQQRLDAELDQDIDRDWE